MTKMKSTCISMIIQSPFSLSVPNYLNKSPQQVLSNMQTDVNAHKPKLQTNKNAHKLKLQTNRNVLIVKELVI